MYKLEVLRKICMSDRSNLLCLRHLIVVQNLGRRGVPFVIFSINNLGLLEFQVECDDDNNGDVSALDSNYDVEVGLEHSALLFVNGGDVVLVSDGATGPDEDASVKRVHVEQGVHHVNY